MACESVTTCNFSRLVLCQTTFEVVGVPGVIASISALEDVDPKWFHTCIILSTRTEPAFSARPEPAFSVRPELVEGLSELGFNGLRQAQPEREWRYISLLYLFKSLRQDLPGQEVDVVEHCVP